MLFVYHPDLIERVVFMVTRSDPQRECELHAQIDRLYTIPDCETRSAAIGQAYADHFAAWKLANGFEAQLRMLCEKCALDRCAMVPASRSRNQKVDLLVKTNAGHAERTLFIQVRPESIIDPVPLASWLRRELLQVADMLDEKFGYVPDAITGSPWERKLRQDRYLVLWRIHVEGRLLRADQADGKEMSSLRAAFDKAFRHHGAIPPPEAFDRVLRAEVLTHGQLLAWAVEPQTVLFKPGAGSKCDTGPGGLCPLCGFPTYDWFDFNAPLLEEWSTSITDTHPSWRPQLGACRQCVETYVYRFRERTRSHGDPATGGEDVRTQPQECLSD